MRALAAIAALSAFAAYPATPSEAGGVEGPTALVGDAHSVWLADTAGQVRRLDARNGTRRFLVDVGGYPNSLALGVGTLWVATADGAGGSIIRLSPATGRRIGPALHVGSGRPLELAVGDQAAWLVNAGDQRVWRINARTGRVEGATLVSAEPWESATVVADRRGAWIAYYSSAAASVLVRLDAGGHVVSRRRIAHALILALAVDRGMLLAASGGDARLLRLDATTGRTRASPIHVGRDPIALTIGLGGVWVSDLGERLALRRIDVNTGRTTAGPFRAPGRSGRADSLAVAGRRVWTTNAYGIASRIDPKTGSRAGRPIRIP